MSKMNAKRAEMREARIMAITGFVQAHTNSIVALPSLVRLSDQDLYLLSNSIDSIRNMPREEGSA